MITDEEILEHVQGMKPEDIVDQVKRHQAKALPWWRKDRQGWPIERIENRSSAWWYTRLVVQNVRKFLDWSSDNDRLIILGAFVALFIFMAFETYCG